MGIIKIGGYMRTIYRIVKNDQELDFLIQSCLESGIIAVDFETNAEPRYSREFSPTILGVSFQPGASWIIPLNHPESIFKDHWNKPFKKFCEAVIMNPNIDKVSWNLQYEYSIFYKYGFPMKGRLFDAMIEKYLLDETRPNDLKSMVDKLLPEFSGYELPGTPGSKASRERLVGFWSSVPLNELSKYCGGDCDFTFRLHLHFENRLIQHNLYHLLRSFYTPLTKILAINYLKGVRVDLDWLSFLDKKYEVLVSNLEKSLYELPEIEDFSESQMEARVDKYISELEFEIDSGKLTANQVASREEKIDRIEAGEPGNKKEQKLFEPVNFGSSKQMVSLLYEDDYGFNFPILDRTDSGAPSTSEDTLKKLLQHDDSGFLEKLLELRGLQKLKSTYITNILTDHVFIDKDNTASLHPSYLPHATVSGRFGSRNPNFQNIPRVTTNPDIKKYIISPEDFYFLEIDGSQMELRVAAEIYKDRAMIEIFREGKNIHVATAARIYGVDYALMNSARKDHNHPQHQEMVRYHKTGKVLNFTIFYGAEGRKVSEFVSERTGHRISPKEGDELIQAWFETFPDAAKGIVRKQGLAKANGFIESPIGRKRRLPILLNKANARHRRGEWNEALRQAVNSELQGFASDLTQMANINIYEAWLRGELPPYLFMESTVHDSLEYVLHKEDVCKVVPKLTQIAGSLRGLDRYLGYKFKHVDLKFSAELGITWGHTEEFNPNINYVDKYEQDITNWKKLKQELIYGKNL